MLRLKKISKNIFQRILLAEVEDVLSLAQRVIRLAILLAALVCVVILIAAGYSYITAAGDEQKIEKAGKTLTYAIVGLVICFISVILVEFVLNNILVAG
jgi:TRAP-type C4-dicarboxylate transport system permease small subunit